MNNEIMPSDYKETLNLIKQKIIQAQQEAIISVNLHMLNLYWDVGNIVLEKKKKQGWGAKVIDNLSKDIRSDFPDIKGFSSRNLDYMTRFARTYNENFETLREYLSRVSWSHNLILMSKIQDENERFWYVDKTVENGWSRDVMILQIESKLYNKINKEEKIHNFTKILPPAQSDLANQMLKDPYNFDFLTLAKHYKEKDLENELVTHITKFLLELGAGFAFVGQQYPIEIGGDDYYIDLLFYHLKLRCYIVIELKARKVYARICREIEFLFISNRRFSKSKRR